MFKFSLWMTIVHVFTLLQFTGCGLISQKTNQPDFSALYQPVPQSNNDLLGRHAPVFLVQDAGKGYNRIGTPAAKAAGTNKSEVWVDHQDATVYTFTQHFQTDRDRYTNLIYRLHFSETPMPHLTSGKNVGLLIYITLDSNEKPVLLTTLHTCGCYLAFVPTSNLPDDSFPANWNKAGQYNFGEELPGLIEASTAKTRFVFDIRSETHRIMEIRNLSAEVINKADNILAYQMKPMADLNRLPTKSGETISFFESEGLRKGYVRGSQKPLERLLMSWWTMDFFIGEDKALGPPEETGAVMYTSLKIWDRDKSNIWYFSDFLKYWGWNL